MQCVLSDRDIVAERLNGNIVISPFDTDSLSNCSYDVKLGEWFYRNEKSLNYFNPWNRDDVAAYWGNPINAADCPCNRDYLRTAKDYEGVPTLSSKNIIVHPGETILAHTQEFIGGRNHITTMMKTRSSLGRSCIATCKCAGMYTYICIITLIHKHKQAGGI